MTAILFLFLIIAFIVFGVMTFSFKSFLKGRHGELFSRFYGDGSMMGRSMNQQMDLLGFLARKKYRQVPDQELQNRFDTVWWMSVVYLVIFLMTVFSFLHDIVSR